MPLNTQIGLGHDRFEPAPGAWASVARMSEHHRQSYRRWANLMAVANLDELPDRRAAEVINA
jgi:hypothetical protein